MISTEDLKTAYLLGRASNNELTPDMLQKYGWNNEKVLKVINTLAEKRLCIYQRNKSTGKICVKVREEQIAQTMRTLSEEDYSVYCVIEDAGNVGAWTFDICKSSGLQSHIVQRAVKSLCDVKKLIKPLKSIHQRNRKMYILANIEPSKEIVGGTFYNNAEFDENLVQQLQQQVLHVLKNTPRATLTEISNYIKNLGFGKDITKEDLNLILETLKLEQRIMSSIDPGTGDLTYMWSRWPARNTFDILPCASCPVSDECIRCPQARVNPEKCAYFDFWLNY